MRFVLDGQLLHTRARLLTTSDSSSSFFIGKSRALSSSSSRLCFTMLSGVLIDNRNPVRETSVKCPEHPPQQ